MNILPAHTTRCALSFLSLFCLSFALTLAPASRPALAQSFAVDAGTQNQWTKAIYAVIPVNNAQQPPASQQSLPTPAAWVEHAILATTQPGAYATDMQVAYQVFQIYPNTRTIAFVPDPTASCLSFSSPNSPPAPDQCDAHIVTVTASGQITPGPTLKSCFFQPDPNSVTFNAEDGEYFRYDQAAGKIEIKTLAQGTQQAACNTSISPQ